MVNEQLSATRKFRIGEILKAIKKHKIVDKKDLIMQICIKYDCQQRKASEYLKIAEYMLKNDTIKEKTRN